MGLFSDNTAYTKNYKSKIDELKSKIPALERGGLNASATRLRKQLAILERENGSAEKVKPMSVGEIKATIKAGKAK
jgi:hypothetical protein